MGEDCVFCGIVAGTEDAFVVFEDETTMAFLDINAVTEGHTLVIPREHHATLTDLDAGATADLFAAVREVAAAIEATIDPDGISVFQSNGAAAGQDVFHVHVHVVPRYPDDSMSLAPTRHRVTPEAGERVVETIREGLDGDRD